MKYRMPLRNRLLIVILSTVAVIYGAGIGYISLRYRDNAKTDALNLVHSVAREKAALIQGQMDRDFAISRSMAISLQVCENSGSKDRESIQFDILTKILEENPTYIASFLQWELSDVLSDYTKSHGRRRYLSYRQYPMPEIVGQPGDYEESPLDTIKGLVDTASFDPKNPYYIIRNTPQEYIIDPYFYSYENVKEMPSDFPTQPDAILETTIIIPVVENNQFKAVAGVDIPLNHFIALARDIQPFEQSFTYVVSNNGHFVAHPSLDLIAKPISGCGMIGGEAFDKFDEIKEGKEFSFVSDLPDKGRMFFVMAPIRMGNTDQPWSLGIGVPESIVMAEAKHDFLVSMIVGLIGFIILALLIRWISVNITRPIESTTQILSKLALGKVDSVWKVRVRSHDEIEDMATSANTLMEGFLRTANFASEIGEGNLKAEYRLLSPEDTLGHSLIEMRDNLQHSKEIIEKKQLELEKLSMVAQQTDNAVIIMDALGNLEWVNQAFEKMYGYSLEEVKTTYGNNLRNLSMHPEIDSVIDQCCTERQTIFYNSQLKSKDGDKKYAHTTITPVVDETGYVNKLVAIDSDITSITQARLEIESQRNELQKLNATKDKFFSILAHDLKNPFASLYSLSNLFNSNFSDLDDDEKKQITQRIYDATSHIYTLLENLLTWSRAQRGLIEVHPQLFNVKELITTAINIHRTAANKKNVTISAHIDKAMQAYADRNMIETVVRNLVNNAIKFTPSNGKVSINAEVESSAVRLIIADTGIGISPEDQKKLFRIDKNTKGIGSSPEKGTGLGLILCKEFIEKNQGQITVKSTEGKGAEFSITIPR